MPRHHGRADMTPERRAEVQRHEKEMAYKRSLGIRTELDPSRAIAHVRDLHARGMTCYQMADQVNQALSRNTFQDLVRGVRTRNVGATPIRIIDRPHEEIVLSVRFEEPLHHGTRQDPVGGRRRMGALGALGYPQRFLADQLGVSVQRVNAMLRRSGKLSTVTLQRIADVYDKFYMTDPADLGFTPYTISRSKGAAGAHGFAPPSCWDADSIDDPDAFPEWTGECGTSMGHAIHLREGIPLCDRCRLAGPGKYRFNGAKLRELREAKGWSLNEVERLLDLGKGHAHHWESGRYGPRAALAERLMSLFDVTFEDLYESEEA